MTSPPLLSVQSASDWFDYMLDHFVQPSPPFPARQSNTLPLKPQHNRHANQAHTCLATQVPLMFPVRWYNGDLMATADMGWPGGQPEMYRTLGAVSVRQVRVQVSQPPNCAKKQKKRTVFLWLCIRYASSCTEECVRYYQGGSCSVPSDLADLVPICYGTCLRARWARFRY